MKKIEGLGIEGAADVEIYNIDSDTFELNIDGAGDVTLEGTCGDAVFEINGAGDLDAEDFLAKVKSTYPDMQLVGGTTIAPMSSAAEYTEGSTTLTLFASDVRPCRLGRETAQLWRVRGPYRANPDCHGFHQRLRAAPRAFRRTCQMPGSLDRKAVVRADGLPPPVALAWRESGASRLCAA